MKLSFFVVHVDIFLFLVVVPYIQTCKSSPWSLFLDYEIMNCKGWMVQMALEGHSIPSLFTFSTPWFETPSSPVAAILPWGLYKAEPISEVAYRPAFLMVMRVSFGGGVQKQYL